MKIVIVGGGTAGWMTASTLVKAYPDWDIVLYEDDKTPSVGVGESTTQFFRLWCHFLDLKDEDWMEACDATYKASVRFHNFNKKGDTPWQYPFGPPRGDLFEPAQWWYYQKKYGWNNAKFAEDYSYAAACCTQNKLPLTNDYWDLHKYTGFHFDAVKFGEWLRDNYALPRGVKRIVRKINPKRLPKADLYFDCTGFKSLLNDSPWVDMSHILPNNSAVVTRFAYNNKEEQMKPVTDCVALDNGWCWNVPTWTRIGSGYVYCDKFCSDKEAIDEFRDYLAENVESDVGAYTDKMFRVIKWTSGRRETMWNGNVVSIGLSAGFIEPLESNGILSIHNFLLMFLRVMDGRKVITQVMRDTFNNNCNGSFDEFATFVAAHFALTQRNDTPYWQHICDKNYPDENSMFKFQRNLGLPSSVFGDAYSWGDLAGEGSFYVQAGHGWNPFSDLIYKELDYYQGGGVPEHVPDPWRGIDKLQCPYDYYKETIYAS